MKLISHRLRGFAARELAIEGLRAALARGVSSVEIDTRVTADGVIVVRHDRFLSGEGGTCAIERLSFEAARARAPELERLEAFLEIAASAPADFELLLDLKGGRAPLQHLALARAHGLAARTTFVSWRPEVLQALMAAAPEQRLAFSHIAMSERGLRQALTRLATAGLSRRAFALGAGLFAPRLAAELRAVDVRRDLSARAGDPDADVAVIASGPLGGPFMEALAQRGDLLCLPLSVETEVAAAYIAAGHRLALFSAETPRDADRAAARGAAYLFVDDPVLFPAR